MSVLVKDRRAADDVPDWCSGAELSSSTCYSGFYILAHKIKDKLTSFFFLEQIRRMKIISHMLSTILRAFVSKQSSGSCYIAFKLNFLWTQNEESHFSAQEIQEQHQEK